MNETQQKDERMIQLLEELVKWTKVTSLPKVKEMIEVLLKTPEQRIAYSISDGRKTTREVAKISGLGKNVVSKEWRKWTRSGIADAIPVPGGDRARSLFPLEDLGIEMPKVETLVNDNKEEKIDAESNEGNDKDEQ
jgi:hypothetical protein